MLLEVKNISAGYGDVQVLWDVSLHVEEGEIVALVGSNGAGKSTLLKVISGIVRPMSGEIFFAGERITGLPSEQIVARGIVQVPEGRRLFPEMSVEENLLMGAYTRRDNGVMRDLEWMYELFPILGERRRQEAGSLSGGEQQMCAVARGLMGRPKLLLIDEMSLGLAPIIVDDLVEIVAQINEQGTTILLVEQDVQVALEQADRGYVLEVGHVVMEGPARELLEDPRVREAYLGI
ncbi:MAG: ABC transporter ATP-binding protein [Chloroflexi bacterium]|nr:MAG: ABC transporter ATP-binding protein [Chloroflexota bacterium]